jgi:cytidine deaminase
MKSQEDQKRKLIEHARTRIRDHAKQRQEKGLYDVMYAFVLSESGEIYEGVPFESNQPCFNFCAERHAINQMQMGESEESKIEAVFVAGPVPDEEESVNMPCGACRHAINEFGDEETPVIASNFIREGKGEWNIFPEIQDFKIGELYPESYETVSWD